eukprot:Seg4086.4 transcript_id=Seg4086.4/GoldUCD/mRNA.D3Y31 product="hypothetical protein" protein_id=Seg4086.4/GoldUCD/D3Y31
MANITTSNDKSNAVQVYAPDLGFLILTFIIAITAIILNCTEIRLILRKWKKATDFEVILFHLAIADLLGSIGNLTTSSFLVYFYVKKSVDTVYWWVTYGILGFFYLVSMKLVLVIGVERLFAIKLPLKHRLWHTSRKMLYRQIFAAWFVSAVVIDSCTLADYFIQKGKGRSITCQSKRGQSSTGQNSTGKNIIGQSGMGIIPSRDVGYILATYMTIGVSIILICYIWLMHIVIVRAAYLPKVGENDYKLNPKMIKLALKKESATIIICRVVLVTFLVCNVPMIVGLYRGKVDGWTINASTFNAIVNPLIYFFKGYVEERLSRKKLEVTPLESGCTKDGNEVVSPYPIISDAGIDLGIVNKGAMFDLHTSTDQELETSRHKAESSLKKLSETADRNDDRTDDGFAKKPSKSDTFLDLTGAKPNQNDQALEGSRDKDESTSITAIKKFDQNSDDFAVKRSKGIIFLELGVEEPTPNEAK